MMLSTLGAASQTKQALFYRSCKAQGEISKNKPSSNAGWTGNGIYVINK
jgi:hypothetical protein